MAEIDSVLTGAGFEDVTLQERFDCFRGTSKENTARTYGVLGINISAMKPGTTG